MQRNQFILIGLAVLLLVGLYFFGFRKSSKTEKAETAQGSNNAAAPNSPTSSIEPIDFSNYEKKAESQLISTDQSKLKALSEKAHNENSPVALKDLAEFWEQQKELNVAANYYKKAAFLENTEKSITFAGNLFLALMQKTEEPELRKWQALEAIDCFTKALTIKPEDVDLKIALATCYTEGTGETMKGVTLLRQVTEKDSNNISANIILGKLAIQSGQLEKAIRRLELVLSLRPENTEAMYFLAEAYKLNGDKPRAIALLEKCKKIVNNPDFTKEIDSYINTFK